MIVAYTQEQLEGMSDDQINEIVSDIHLKDVNDIFKGLSNPHGKRWADYCNNWADMGPLIEDLSQLGTVTICNNGFSLITKPLTGIFYSERPALRAAAIVYILVMQEKSK